MRLVLTGNSVKLNEATLLMQQRDKKNQSLNMTSSSGMRLYWPIKYEQTHLYPNNIKKRMSHEILFYSIKSLCAAFYYFIRNFLDVYLNTNLVKCETPNYPQLLLTYNVRKAGFFGDIE